MRSAKTICRFPWEWSSLLYVPVVAVALVCQSDLLSEDGEK